MFDSAVPHSKVSTSRFARYAAAALSSAMLLTGVGASAAFASGSSSSSSALQKSLQTIEAAAPSSPVTLTETGSSLFYPLFSTWAQSYTNKNTSIQTASTGSGAGQSGALAGTVNIGASDAYLPASDPATLLNVPVVVSAQQIDYNLPGLPKGTHLKLSAHVLAAIYNGSVSKWNDPAITKLNKGVNIPATPIVTVHRSDSSGDTFLFASYLAYGDPTSFVATSGGPNTTVNWPNVSGALAAKGNTGMLSVCESTPGCIAYIGVSYLRSAIKAGLGVAQLQNGAGNFVQLTPKNIENEIASYKKIPTNGTISLVYSKTAKFGYPIVNFEYAIVQQNQTSSTTAAAIKALLAWGMDPKGGSSTKYLAPVDFQPLPANALAVAVNLLKSIQ
jgi:phosphate transport system substrate-binding protein